MSKSWYQIKGRSNGAGETHIDILEGIGGFGVSAKHFREAIQRLGEAEPLHVHINSDGGDIIEGNEIYNVLMEHKGPVRVSVGALAASMASVIAMAGNSISIAENGFIMIHNPWTIAMGDAEEMKKVAGVLDQLKSGIVRAYQRQTDLQPDEISALMSEESWFTAEEAKELGFVDSITVPADKGDEAQAANFNVRRFHNSAAFINQLRRNDMKNTTKEKLLNNGDPEPGDDPIAAERARISEIQGIADAVLKRDGKDFRNEAKKAIADGVSADAFSKALITSDRFKSAFIQIGSEENDLPWDVRRNSLGALVIANDDYKRMVARGGLSRSQSLAINLPVNYGKLRRQQFRNAATPLTGLPGTAVDITPQIAGLGIQMARVADLVTGLTTGGSSVRYISETNFVNAAAPVAEGAPKPEQVWNLVEIDSPVRKIAVWSKCSDEVVSDHSRLAAFINNKLMLGVELSLDQEIVSGSGIAPHLTGILNFAGIATQAKAADTAYDAIRKAVTKVRTGAFVEPDAVILHPLDDEKLALLKDTNGQYLGGGPRTGPYGVGPYDPNSPIWRLQPIVTTAIAVGTALVGSFRYGAELYWREGMTVDMTNCDQDDFIKNLITIRAELRAALAIPHPQAFCQVTGL